MPEGVPISRHSLEIDSETVSFLEAGSGPCLLLLHSFGASSDLWRPQLTAFGADHRVIAPDLRGHGGSSWNSGLQPVQMAFDAIDLCRRLGCADLVVVGLSMGANVAIQLAALEPSLVRGLVLASAFTAPSPRLQEVLTGVSREAELVLDMTEYAQRRAQRMLLASGDAEGFLAGAGRMSKAVLARLGRSLARWNVTPLLQAVAVPTLLVVGEDDPYVSLEMAQEIAQKLPRAEVVSLPGAGHICNLDAPEAFNRELRGFLERL